MAHTKWQLKSNLNGRIYFPLTAARIRGWIKEGRVSEDDKVWCSGYSGWRRASEVEEFKSSFKEVEKEEVEEAGEKEIKEESSRREETAPERKTKGIEEE